MIDYMRIMIDYYPNNIWGGSCRTYEQIMWKDTTAPKPTKAELLALWDVVQLDISKEDKILATSAMVNIGIERGFYSLATGTLFFYRANTEDQRNLIGSVASGIDMPFPTRINQTDTTKTYVVHTHEQLRRVLNDGAVSKLAALQKFNNFKIKVNACKNIDELALVVWP